MSERPSSTRRPCSRRSLLTGRFFRDVAQEAHDRALEQQAARPTVDSLVAMQQQRAKAMVAAVDGPRVARIQAIMCLAYRGVPCSTCREQCPVPGAIAVDMGKPTIVADTCTGCGDCACLCPAPTPAIAILPRLPAPTARITP